MKRNKTLKINTDIKLLEKNIIKFRSNQIVNQDKKHIVIKNFLSEIYNYIDSLNIDDNNGSTHGEYQKILHAINGIYNYLYNPQNSNLDIQDAKIFASYVLDKIKGLKNLVEKIDQTQNKINF